MSHSIPHSIKKIIKGSKKESQKNWHFFSLEKILYLYNTTMFLSTIVSFFLSFHYYYFSKNNKSSFPSLTNYSWYAIWLLLILMIIHKLEYKVWIGKKHKNTKICRINCINFFHNAFFIQKQFTSPSTTVWSAWMYFNILITVIQKKNRLYESIIIQRIIFSIIIKKISFIYNIYNYYLLFNLYDTIYLNLKIFINFLKKHL